MSDKIEVVPITTDDRVCDAMFNALGAHATTTYVNMDEAFQDLEEAKAAFVDQGMSERDIVNSFFRAKTQLYQMMEIPVRYLL